MKSKLAICYRIYPGVSKVPAIHSDNKLKMSELAIRSFVRALDGLEPKIWVILDNCGEEYNQMFRKYLAPFQHELINLEKAGNAATFGLQMDILSNQEFSEFVYFAEDDYFFLDNAFIKTLEVLKQGKADFATPYNHPDLYNFSIHNYKYEIEEIDGLKWRNAASTTMSFMTTRKNLKKYYRILNTYTKLNYDASMWFAMTKIAIRNPLKILKNSLANYSYFNIYLKLIYFSPFSFFGKSAVLLNPMSSLATHLDNKGLPPEVDWYKEFEKLNNVL